MEAGISLPGGAVHSGLFIWRFSDRAPDEKIKSFPGGAAGLVCGRGYPGGSGSAGSGRFRQPRRGPASTSHRPAPDAMPVQVQAGQFAFYFRYPGPDGKFGPIHPDQISEATENFFGLDTDSRSGFQGRHRDRRNGGSGQPRGSFADALQRCRPFLLCAGAANSAGFRSRSRSCPSISRRPRSAGTKLSARQLCGLGHYNMKAYLEVMSQQDFDEWLKKQAALQ